MTVCDEPYSAKITLTVPKVSLKNAICCVNTDTTSMAGGRFPPIFPIVAPVETQTMTIATVCNEINAVLKC